MDQRAGQSDRQSRWNPMDLRYDGAPEARAVHARGIPRTTGPGARTAALFGEGSGKESFAESDPVLDVAQRRYLQRLVQVAGRGPDRGHGPIHDDRVGAARRQARDQVDRLVAGGDGHALRRHRTDRSATVAPCPLHHGCAVALPGAPIHLPIRCHRSQWLRPGRDGRGDWLDSCRRQGQPGQDRSNRSATSERGHSHRQSGHQWRRRYVGSAAQQCCRVRRRHQPE